MWSKEQNYQLVGDGLIVDVSLPEEQAGLISLNQDPRKQAFKPDCYSGRVKETGARCKLVKPGDEVVFTRWEYSQSEVDDSHTALREVDLVIVNNQCVNNFVAVKLHKPFKKTEELITVEKRWKETPKSYWGQVISIDHSRSPLETRHLKEGDVIFFQHMEDYQYYIGAYTMVFKNVYDVILMIMEEAPVLAVA